MRVVFFVFCFFYWVRSNLNLVFSEWEAIGCFYSVFWWHISHINTHFHPLSAPHRASDGPLLSVLLQLLASVACIYFNKLSFSFFLRYIIMFFLLTPPYINNINRPTTSDGSHWTKKKIACNGEDVSDMFSLGRLLFILLTPGKRNPGISNSLVQVTLITPEGCWAPMSHSVTWAVRVTRRKSAVKIVKTVGLLHFVCAFNGCRLCRLGL